jgi:hypothetical protein
MPESPLIDRLYQLTYGKPVKEWQSNKRMRQALTEAHRFVLDPPMSAFLADIAFAVCNKREFSIAAQSIDFARCSARLPHHVTWIEFDWQRYAQREIELGGELLNFEPPDNETYRREGWLLNGHNSDADGFRVHLFHELVRDGASIIRACPLVVTWRTNADPRPLFGDSMERRRRISWSRRRSAPASSLRGISRWEAESW